LALPVAAAGAEVAFGAKLRSYRFDKYRTRLKSDQRPALKTLSLASGDVAAARRAFADLDKVADGVAFARDLIIEPANVITPETLAAECLKLKGLGLSVDVLDEKQMQKMGMGALLGVAQGSVRPPRFVSLVWQGQPTAKDKRPIAFVGKGVTFDTGGISLKPPGGMEEMKTDMAGAAAVIGTMKVLAARKAAVHAVGLVGLAENMLSGAAQRPGDIVTSLSGQTIEVINTDAEGRLVLADALWYAQEKFNPRCLINLATLTGAMIVALGRDYAGLFANDDKLAEQLTQAGQATDEKVWRFPMGESYDKTLDSSVADMKNVPSSREAGSITAAQFLQRFVKKGTAWAHIDIAGTARLHKDAPTCPKGPSGFGVRLLDKLVAECFEGKI
ncbi:MAG: leucyl aminopeptidase, partial [Alphaproteobacteria bacterium]|nr:leucyl aminopeptidase [Alphaproteobacteria bacterium]